jgi:hypothetical protein
VLQCQLSSLLQQALAQLRREGQLVDVDIDRSVDDLPQLSMNPEHALRLFVSLLDCLKQHHSGAHLLLQSSSNDASSHCARTQENGCRPDDPNFNKHTGSRPSNKRAHIGAERLTDKLVRVQLGVPSQAWCSALSGQVRSLPDQAENVTLRTR